MNSGPPSPERGKQDVSPPPATASKDLFHRYGIQTKDFAVATEQIQGLMKNDFKNRPEQREQLEAAWAAHVAATAKSYASKFDGTTSELLDGGEAAASSPGSNALNPDSPSGSPLSGLVRPPIGAPPNLLTGERRAELLTRWSQMAEKYTAVDPKAFPIPNVDRVVEAWRECATSASVFIRSLSFHAAKFMVGDPAFASALFAARGHFPVCQALDAETAHDSEPAFELVAAIVMHGRRSFDTRVRQRQAMQRNAAANRPLPTAVSNQSMGPENGSFSVDVSNPNNNAVSPISIANASPNASMHFLQPPAMRSDSSDTGSVSPSPILNAPANGSNTGTPSGNGNGNSSPSSTPLPKSYPAPPLGVVMRLVTMIDANDSRLQNLGLQMRHRVLTLVRDILKVWPLQASAAGALRTVLHTCVHGTLSREQKEMMLETILWLIDSPTTRRVVRNADLAVLFAPFMESHPTDEIAHVQLMNAAKEVIVRIMCTWPGLLWVSTETTCLRSLIDTLHLPGSIDRKMVAIHLFADCMRRTAPHRGIPKLNVWLGATEAQKSRKMTLHSMSESNTGFDMLNESDDLRQSDTQWDLMDDEEDDESVPTTKAVGYNALDPFLATQLMVFNRAGLPRGLMMLISRASGGFGQLVEEAATILQHLLVLLDTVLPQKHAAVLHDALSTETARHTDSLEASQATLKLFSHLAQSNRVQQAMLGITAGPTVINGGAPGRGGASLTMEDGQFQQLVRDTMVESHNEHSKWNYELLLVLVQGPLRSIHRLRWARDNTRFFTRVLGFYKPSVSRQCFFSLSRNEAMPGSTAVGVALLDVLLATRDGVEILEKAEFCKAMKQALVELNEKRPQFLTSERVLATKTHEFFRVFGRFTSTSYGLMLLIRHNIFGLLQQLFESVQFGVSQSRSPSGLNPAAQGIAGNVSPQPQVDLTSDVCHRLLQNLHLETVPNYGVCVEARLLLKLALNCRVTLVRLSAVMQLRKVMWRDLSGSLQWGIDCLMECLNDPTFSVVEHAFRLLSSICCSSEEALDYLIALKPVNLVHNKQLSEHRSKLNTAALLFRLLGRPDGYAFLQDNEWVDETLSAWADRDSQSFVDEMDRALQLGFDADGGVQFSSSVGGGGGSPGHPPSPTGHRRSIRHHRTNSDPISASNRGHRTRGVSITAAMSTSHALFPPHLAEELCRTEAGCKHFASSNLWANAINTLMTATEPDEQVATGNPSFFGVGGSVSSPLLSASMMADFDDDGAGLDITYNGSANVGITSDSSFNYVLPSAHFSEDIAEDLGELLFLEEVQVASLQLSRAAAKEKRKEAKADPLLISASRGYEAESGTKSVMCRGEPRVLKAAIFTAAHAAASTVGFQWVRKTYPEVLTRLLELSRYASHPSVRGAALVASSLAARSTEGAEYLRSEGYDVVSESSAYLSFLGVPFSVAFCHPRTSNTWTQLVAVPHQGHTPSVALREVPVSAASVDTEIAENAKSLINPVQREGAKQRLYQAFKTKHQPFVDPKTIMYLQYLSNVHRMRHAERKFISDLLMHARSAEIQRRKQLRAAEEAVQSPVTVSVPNSGGVTREPSSADVGEVSSPGSPGLGSTQRPTVEQMAADESI